ncbi:hypothetical protein KZ843_09615 [Pseudomonas aeruginosa]|nr:hypothetical protein [Pseudomonas aeruginosa]MBW6123142.1 hypothetical protein [Pseudomonas aeruginosa]
MRNEGKAVTEKTEATQRGRKIAMAAAMFGVGMLLLWQTVPAWVPVSFQPKFSALFLSAAFAFELLAVGAMISMALVKRDHF